MRFESLRQQAPTRWPLSRQSPTSPGPSLPGASSARSPIDKTAPVAIDKPIDLGAKYKDLKGSPPPGGHRLRSTRRAPSILASFTRAKTSWPHSVTPKSPVRLLAGSHADRFG